ILLKKYDEEDEDSKAAVSMALGFTLTIAGLFLGIEYITTFLKVTLAPKVYLIEYASNLIK
ncbi:hypothetical protein H8D85_02100, partial [bacterium]|nr:hypothetical protein [bacterium]